MSTEAIIVLSLTGVGFLFLLVWALVWGRKVQWPEGTPLEQETEQGIKVLVFNPVSIPNMPKGLFSVQCCSALSCLFKVWDRSFLSKSNKKSKSNFDVIGIQFIPDEEMDERMKKQYGDPDILNKSGKSFRVSAYLDQAYRAIGTSPPLIIIAERFADNVVRSGEPIIHEGIHALLGEYKYDFDHNHDHEAWKILSENSRLEYMGTVTHGA